MTETERAERCETCRFWADRKYRPLQGFSWCCRYPPAIYPELAPELKHFAGDESPLVRREAMASKFPQTTCDDWCGEWQPIGPDLRHAGTSGDIEKAIAGHKLLNILAPILGLSDRVYRVEIIADVTKTADVRIYERGTREQGKAATNTMRAFELVEREAISF